VNSVIPKSERIQHEKKTDTSMVKVLYKYIQLYFTCLVESKVKVLEVSTYDTHDTCIVVKIPNSQLGKGEPQRTCTKYK